MDELLNNSQQLILGVLSKGEKMTYEDISDETGLSYDGVRGRISEMVQLGINIQRIRSGKHTLVFLDEKISKKKRFTTPKRYAELVSERLKSINDFQNVSELLNELRDNIPEYVRTPFYKESKKSAVLLLSDLHFGEIIKDENSEVVFNTKIAIERLNTVFDETLNLLEKYDISTLRILMIGDMVDGDSIYKNHLFRIEKSAIEQVKDFVRAVSNNIKTIASIGFDIRVDAVRGNHGITNYKNLEEDNWDNVAYDMLDLIFSDHKNVLFNHFQSDQVKVPVLDRNFVLYHGDNMGDQIKTAAGLRTFRGIVGRHRLQDSDIVVIGHLHQFGIESDQGKYLIRNGALPSASEYAMKLNLFSTPEQTLLIIEEGAHYPIIIPIEVE